MAQTQHDPVTAWLNRTTGGASWRALGARLDQTYQRVQRQLEKRPPDLGFVIRVARAYKTNPVDGLVEIGALETAEVGTAQTENALRSVDDLVLVREIVRRLEDRGSHPALEAPLQEIDFGVSPEVELGSQGVGDHGRGERGAH